MIRVTISPPLAAFLGFLVGALVHLPVTFHAAREAGAGVLATMAFDAAHVLSAGALAAACVRGFLLGSRGRLIHCAAALWLLAIVVGWPVLEPDFHNFAIRHSDKVPTWLTRLLLTWLTSISIPMAFVVGRFLARFRFGPWVGLLAAVVTFAMNERVLPRDYSGIHVYLGWLAATLAGASLSGVTVPTPLRLPALSTRAGIGLPLAAGVAGFAMLALWRPAARVQSALDGLDAAALVRYTGRLHVLGRRRVAKPPVHDRWLERRDPVPLRTAKKRRRATTLRVILVTVDALRADVVNSGTYDHLLPNFVKLKKQSIVFTQARATATATRPSIASMNMGTYTFQQIWREGRDIFAAAPQTDRSVRFPELLTRARVRTANLSSMGAVTNALGTVRGFKLDKRVDTDGLKYAPAGNVIDEIIGYLDKKSPPLFCYSHLGDPHEPYTLAGRDGTPFENYLGEVALVDTALGRLLEHLSDERFGKKTVLIVSADHGESFGEHNSSSHGTTVYDEALRVPLLVYSPKYAPRVVSDLVSLIDLGPTILELFGLKVPKHVMGESLVPYFKGKNPTLTRPIIGEARSLLAYVTPQRLKVIVDTDTGRTELYDLRKDPLELDNIADDIARLERPLAYLEAFFETHRLRLDGYTPPAIR